MTRLDAFVVSDDNGWTLAPAETRRKWMDETDRGFANRCLPLLIANQMGWDVGIGPGIRATWTGEPEREAMAVTYLTELPAVASSHFGHGILTFNLPWLFKTDPGWHLLVRGPVNPPKHGIVPLEGVVQTDSAHETFTMNWRFTAPGTVIFKPRSVIANLLPVHKGALEAFTPRVARPTAELDAQYQAWKQSRTTFSRDLTDPESEAAKKGWQRDYFLRSDRKLKLQPFAIDYGHEDRGN